ncbi:MAG: hypothetical protein OHK0036_15160 [Bacteroidia bacterium]
MYTSIIYTQNKNWEWVLYIGSPGFPSEVGDITIKNNNYYLRGVYGGTPFRIGSYIIPDMNGSTEMYIAKMDTNLNILWAKHFGANNCMYLSYCEEYEYINSFVVDDSDNVYVSGITTGPNLTFDSIVLPGNISTSNTYYTSSFFVAKYNKNGKCVWAKNTKNPNVDYPLWDSGGIILEKGEYLFVRLSKVTVPLIYDQDTIPANMKYIIKINKSNGQIVDKWKDTLAGSVSPNTYYFDIISHKNNYYILGDGSILMRDTMGNKIWEIRPLGSYYIFNKMFMYKDTLYALGIFTEIGIDGNLYTSSSSNWDLFLMKIAPDGKVIYLKPFGGSGRETLGIISFNKDNIYIMINPGAYSFYIDSICYVDGSTKVDPNRFLILNTNNGKCIQSFHFYDIGITSKLSGNFSGSIDYRDVLVSSILFINDNMLMFSAFENQTTIGTFTVDNAIPGCGGPSLLWCPGDMFFAKMKGNPLTNNIPSTNKIIEDYFFVYPNPSDGSFNIDISYDLLPCSLKIIDITGRVLFNKELSDSTNTLHIPNYASGTYIFQIKTKEGKTMQKKVIKK